MLEVLGIVYRRRFIIVKRIRRRFDFISDNSDYRVNTFSWISEVTLPTDLTKEIIFSP